MNSPSMFTRVISIYSMHNVLHIHVCFINSDAISPKVFRAKFRQYGKLHPVLWCLSLRSEKAGGGGGGRNQRARIGCDPPS